MDAWRTPKLVLPAHLPDQRAQFCLDTRAPSPRVRFPTPIVTEAGSMPPHQRLRLDNRNDLQDRRKPSIHLDEEPALVVGGLGSTLAWWANSRPQASPPAPLGGLTAPASASN